MHLIQYMWLNYTKIVMGEGLTRAVIETEATYFLWHWSYLLVSLAVVLAVSIPAVRSRDVTYAALHGLIFGAVMGVGFAGVALIAGTVGSVLEFGQLLTVPALMCLFVALAGYVGGMLTYRDVLEKFGRTRALVLANDNDVVEIADGAILIEKVLAPNSQYIRIFDRSHKTLPGEGELNYADASAGTGAVPPEKQLLSASGL